MIKRSLMWSGKILTDRPYDKNQMKYMEFSHEIPSTSLWFIGITFILSIIGIILGVISIIN